MILNLIDPTILDFFFNLLLFILVFGFFYSFKFLPDRGEEDKSKLKETDFFKQEVDVLGQPLKSYNDRSESYRPIGKINFRLGLLVIVISFAFVLIFQNSKKVEPISGAGGYSFVDEAKKWPSYKLYKDPMFPVEYTVIKGERYEYTRELYDYEKEWYRHTFGLESPPKMTRNFDTINSSFKYLKEPYFTTKKN